MVVCIVFLTSDKIRFCETDKIQMTIVQQEVRDQLDGKDEQ